MKIKQLVSVAWKICDKGCCEDYANVKFYGSPSKALDLANKIAAENPTTFRIEIFQYVDQTLEYDEWYEENEDELLTQYHEGGYYLDTDMEKFCRNKYEEYYNQLNPEN